MILVDSSYWIDLMRAGIDARHRLLPWLKAGELVICGPIRAEVLRGMRDPIHRAQMEDFMDLIPDVPSDATFWRSVTRLAWETDRMGTPMALIDLMIAEAARRAGATLVTRDRAFKRLPGLKVLSELPTR